MLSLLDELRDTLWSFDLLKGLFHCIFHQRSAVLQDFGVALEMSEPSSEYVDRAVDLLKQGTSLLLSFMLMRFAGVSIECIIMLRLK